MELAGRRLVLASRSPQRRTILEQLGLTFDVRPTDAPEAAAGDPRAVATGNAERKAAAARPAGEEVVLGADTVVVVDGRILDKPADEAEARRHLTLLSGRSHLVVGGICVADAGRSESLAVVTDVTFRALSEAELEWFVASGQWRERAGAYAIQERGAALVEEISGDYFNVVGLSVAGLLRLIPDLIGNPGA